MIVNTCVCLNPSNKMVLTWNILPVEGSGTTVQQLFDDVIAAKIQPDLQLDSASLGKSKNMLDKIDLNLPLDSAVELFGPFLRYHVHDAYLPRSPPSPMRNAFDILMSSQRSESLPVFVRVVHKSKI